MPSTSPPAKAHPLHDAEVRALLERLEFEFQGESRQGIHYYRPLQDRHLSMSLILGPSTTLSDLVDAIFTRGCQSQAAHIGSCFRGLLHSVNAKEETFSPVTSLLSEPVRARHALLSMGPLLTLERCQYEAPGRLPLFAVVDGRLQLFA